MGPPAFIMLNIIGSFLSRYRDGLQETASSASSAPTSRICSYSAGVNYNTISGTVQVAETPSWTKKKLETNQKMRYS